MGVTRLNHAVLFVRDAEVAAEFYGRVFGFRNLGAPPGMRAAFMRASGTDNHHDLGLFEVGANAVKPPRGSVGLYHLAWEVDTLDELEVTAQRLAEAGALVGTSDHGTTKSLYGRDPSGLEFEIVWIIPADLLDDEAREARKQIGPLDIAKEKARYGGQTRGGVGVSVPA